VKSRMIIKLGMGVLAVAGALGAAAVANASVSESSASSSASTAVPSGYVRSVVFYDFAGCMQARNEFVNEFRTVSYCDKAAAEFPAYTFLIQKADPDDAYITSPVFGSFEECEARHYPYVNEFRDTQSCTNAGGSEFAWFFAFK
jgi:hypothetical protein